MTNTSQKYAYSEKFFSLQGEGRYTGTPTVWLRYFTCNLMCNGFGQKDPTDPSTYQLPYLELAERMKHDKSLITDVTNLPVFKYGCDSSYSWHAGYKHLQTHATALDIAKGLHDLLKNPHNPEGLFKHPVSGQEQHLCLTGGEPLLKNAQQCTTEIIKSFRSEIGIDGPKYITFETNGTQKLSDQFIRFFQNSGHGVRQVFMSISPKLWTVAGEKNEKAIRPDTVAGYKNVSPDKTDGQLKFVLGTCQTQWDELDRVIDMYRKVGVEYPVYIMPVGAREEEQVDVGGTVANMAIARGYNVSARVHVYLYGNVIGT